MDYPLSSGPAWKGSPFMTRRCATRRPIRLLGLLLAALAPLLGASEARATSVEFSFLPPAATVAEGATQLFVEVFVDQAPTADVGGGISLGFVADGVVTDVTLASFGPAIDASFSFALEDQPSPDGIFIDLAIGAAPTVPGGFGTGVDFVLAILELTIDTSLGSVGSLSIADATPLIGTPAIDPLTVPVSSNVDGALGTEEGPFTETFLVEVVVPEPARIWLLAPPVVAAAVRWRRG